MRTYIRGRGAGRQRDYYAIKKFLDEREIQVGQVATDVGLDKSTASHTIRGWVNNRKILHRLIDLGCPLGILSLPRDMKEELNAKNSN